MSEKRQRVAVVTGGASGIGLATVERLASDGWKVALFSEKEKTVAEARDRLQSLGLLEATHLAVVDLRDHDAVKRFFESVAARFGTVAALVNNAAFVPPKGPGGRLPLAEVTQHEWRDVLAVNLTGVMLTAKAAVTAMRANPDGPTGAIIINSSMSAYRPMGNFVAYSTTKGALIALSKSVAMHCANAGTRIRCNSIHPGVVETDMIRTVIDRAPDPAAARAQFEGMAPMRRMAQVAEVAALVAFLASDEAAFISGSEYGIDGASTAGMMGV
jgi:NAD(P)-dependent dehydrogenase (short-subunit alcohol dehydrogenase family)